MPGVREEQLAVVRAHLGACRCPSRVEQVERLVEQRAARHGDRQPVAHPQRLLGRLRHVHALDVERHAAGGQRPAEAAEQVVVAAAAAEREAHGRVVDLEHRARVVAELAHEAEVEDHPVGHAALGEQLVQRAQPCDRRRPAPSARSSTSGPPRSSGSSHEQLARRRRRAPSAVTSQLEAHEVAPRERTRAAAVCALLAARRARPAGGGRATPSPTPTRWRRRPGLVERRDRQRHHLGVALGAGRRRSARARPGGTRAARPLPRSTAR